MATFDWLSFVVIIVATSTISQAAEISINGSLETNKTSTLTITCAIGNISAAEVLEIEIYKDGNLTAVINYTNSTATVVPLPGLTQFANATGTLTPSSSAALSMVVYDATCAYSGQYECRVSFRVNTSSSPETSVDTTTLSAERYSGPVEIREVGFKEAYVVNDILQLVCSADIGSQGKWHWEYSDQGNDSWKTIPTGNGVQKDSSPNVINGCRSAGISSLNYTVTSVQDDGRMFRCYFDTTTFTGIYTLSVLNGLKPGLTSLVSTCYVQPDGSLVVMCTGVSDTWIDYAKLVITAPNKEERSFIPAIFAKLNPGDYTCSVRWPNSSSIFPTVPNGTCHVPNAQPLTSSSLVVTPSLMIAAMTALATAIISLSF